MIVGVKKIYSTLQLFRKAYGAYKFQFGLIVILGFLSGIAGGLGISSIIPLFALAVHQQGIVSDKISKIVERVFSLFHVNYSLPLLLGLMLALFISKVLFTLAANYINAKISADYEFRTRNKLFRTTLSATWQYLIHQKTGYLERVMLDDVYMGNVTLAYLSSTILAITSLITYAAIAINLSFKITGITLILGAIILIVFKPLFRKARVSGENLTSTNKKAAHYINENVIGAKTLKATGVEDKVARKGEAYFQELKNTRIKLSVYNSLGGAFIEPLGLIFIVILFELSYKSAGFNIASFAAIIYLIQKIFSFVGFIQSRLHTINEIIPNVRTTVEYQDKAAANTEDDFGKDQFRFERSLAFADVHFSYTPNKKILSGINFSLQKGEMLGLIGPSGAGKTTIVDLILRLFVPQSGAILMDGKDISAIDMRNWRKNISYVSQDIFLANDTIENNIRFYNDTFSQEDIAEAAKMANIYDFITEQPEKFNAVVGERGIKISGGQRQRIILARALLRKPKILILDEATSALDNESEALIQETIKNLKGKVTVLVSAHRLSTIKNSDRLIILEDGKIVEEGTPQILLQNKDSYFYRVSHITDLDSNTKEG